MNIDYAAIHAAARRERALALSRFVYAPVGAFFQKLFRTEPRKPSTVFPSMRGC